KPPVNLSIASVQAPTDAHLGDPFEITAFVQAEGLAGKTATVELLSRPEGETSEPSLVESKELALADNGVPIEVTFKLNPATTGSVEYLLRAKTATKASELSDADNERRKTIRVTDRKTKVLLFAGGPMRDYVFLKNMLFRHKAIEVDVLLQTADPGTAVSQESNKLLFEFPKSREELFPYDVIVAFDPDWRKVTPEQQSNLREWVFAQSGGLILVAGDVNTSSLASGGDEVKPIQELCPVTLSSLASDLLADASGPQAWPIGFTRAGLEAGFLQLTDDTISSAAVATRPPARKRERPCTRTSPTRVRRPATERRSGWRRSFMDRAARCISEPVNSGGCEQSTKTTSIASGRKPFAN
ncbi:MAG: hypothetical protein FD138_4226, partial [Planctomycetota bacterium]